MQQKALVALVAA